MALGRFVDCVLLCGLRLGVVGVTEDIGIPDLSWSGWIQEVQEIEGSKIPVWETAGIWARKSVDLGELTEGSFNTHQELLFLSSKI